MIAVSCKYSHNICSFVEIVYLSDSCVQIAVHLLATEDRTCGMNIDDGGILGAL